MKPLVLAAAALLVPAAAGAHDLWIQRDGDGFVVRYGHAGGEALPLDAARLRARCGDGARPPHEVAASARSSREVRLPGPCRVVSALLDGGTWTLTPDGEVNRPRSQVANAVRAWTSRQYAKWVDARSGAAGAVLGDELEVAPVTDLARAHRGDKVAVRVLARGAPVRDAVVALGHRTLGQTDSRGELRLRLRDAGLETLSASIRRPLASRDADAEVLEATLSFEVAP